MKSGRLTKQRKASVLTLYERDAIPGGSLLVKILLIVRVDMRG